MATISLEQYRKNWPR